MALDLPPLPDGYVTTRAGLHALTEHVLSPLRYRAEGRIGLQADRRRLRAAPAGRSAGRGGGRPAPRRRPDDPHHHARRRRTVPRRIRSARRPRCTQPATDAEPGPTPRRRACRRPRWSCGWFAFGAGVLAQVAAGAAPDDDPSEVQLWPEHFDLACSVGPDGGRANVGASPGDADHDAPYLYVGPWEPRPGGLWNEPWGASLGYQAIRAGRGPTRVHRGGAAGASPLTSRPSEPLLTGVDRPHGRSGIERHRGGRRPHRGTGPRAAHRDPRRRRVRPLGRRVPHRRRRAGPPGDQPGRLASARPGRPRRRRRSSTSPGRRVRRRSRRSCCSRAMRRLSDRVGAPTGLAGRPPPRT